MKQYFCLGSYTEPILFGTGEVFQGKGKGVYICSFEDGEIKRISSLEVRNPSFVCVDEKQKKIYAVNEMKEYLGVFGGGVTQISYDEKGKMTSEFTDNTGAMDPCHIIVSPDRKFVSIANFASGAVTTYGLDENGCINTEKHVYQHEGHSVHPKRQQGPHAHSTIFTPDGKYMFVPDLGIDTVKAYTYENDENGQIDACPDKDLKVAAGNGPRFGEFHPNGKDFYLINEIGSRVEHYTYEDGTMVYRDGIGTLPEGFPKEDNICSDLHITPDGKYLYASNRGHDSLVVCSFREDGSLNIVETISCEGKTPRNFAIDPTGAFILVGNQDSDTIVTFRIEEDGRLKRVSTYGFGSPVCIQFFKETMFA